MRERSNFISLGRLLEIVATTLGEVDLKRSLLNRRTAEKNPQRSTSVLLLLFASLVVNNIGSDNTCSIILSEIEPSARQTWHASNLGEDEYLNWFFFIVPEVRQLE